MFTCDDNTMEGIYNVDCCLCGETHCNEGEVHREDDEWLCDDGFACSARILKSLDTPTRKV